MKIRGFLVTDGPKAKGLKPNKKESWVLGPTTRSHSLCPIKKLIGLKAQLPHYIKKEKKRKKKKREEREDRTTTQLSEEKRKGEGLATVAKWGKNPSQQSRSHQRNRTAGKHERKK
jgi:hypothetical protein